MKSNYYQTDAQLQHQAFQLLSKELGVVNFIRFYPMILCFKVESNPIRTLQNFIKRL
jgi:hypothetical protein